MNLKIKYKISIIYIYNYIQEKRGLINKEFKEEPLTISLHPCGMFIAIGFVSGI